MKRESFLIYKSFYEPIKFLDDEKLGKLFRALFEYQIDKKDCEDVEIKMAFEFFKNQFRLDNEKYEKMVERNKENGKKGGRPKQSKENPKNPMGYKKPKKPDNDNDNDNENVNDNDITTTSNIYEFIENNFARTLAPLEYEKINKWLLSFNEDIVRYAIELAVLNGKKTFNYADGILKNWKSENYTTLEEIKEKDKKNVPSWYGKEVSEEKANKEEIEDIENLLKEFD